ncbi:MAG: DEAD/DEAH box helicase [Victivallaceae bacterium]|nr:DEAD/DEAH box helicase [Victivallaceae bacterium]
MKIELVLHPSGNLRIISATASDYESWDAPENTSKILTENFAYGNGRGLLALIREELPAGIPAPFRYFRKQAREFITRLCHVQEPENRDLTGLFKSIRPDRTAFGFEALEAPPMRGAEYISADWLMSLHLELELQVQNEFNAAAGSFSEWVRKLNPAWKSVGKVSFHLAENKQDKTGDYPFAFIATFIHRLSENDVPKHLPLGAAVKAYANDRNALLTLLRPVQSAGERSDLIAKLLDSREIFRPQAWTARQAYNFLCDIPLIEESGVIVRIANIWKNTTPSKVKVSVNIDLKKGQKLGINAMLDFSFKTVLNGMELTGKELEQLLNSEGGLVRIKGEWVEAEPDKIKALLQQWSEATHVTDAGFSFFQGLRMLAGANLPGMGATPEVDREFCSVNASGKLKELLSELQSPSLINLPELPKTLKNTLRPYQLDGVRWLWRMTELGMGGCLADDMGLGKTLQVLTMLLLLKQRGDTKQIPALLVVPASLLQNWRLEAAKFTPDLRFGILHPMTLNDEDMEQLSVSPESYLQQFDAVVTTYGMLSRLECLRKISWTAVIIDEAQAIKNPQSKQSRAVRSLHSSRRLALTGTPVENRITDLWSVFDFISPGLLGHITGFKDFIKKLNTEDGNVNYAPLRQLTKPYIMRRLKTDKSIITDLPDKTEMKVYCQLAKPQAVLYQQAVREMARELKEADDIKRRGLVFKYLMMFKQICNHPAQFSGNGEYDADSGGKFLRLSEIAEEIDSRQEKMLVFTQFKEMTEPLHEHLSRCFGRPGLVLHGGTSIKQRQHLVEHFQSESGPPFFVLSLKAAGTGLNLTAANHVVHFDRWWNPAVENQATDRAFRIGQRHNVLVHKFICRGTVEEKIDALIDDKKGLADSLLSDGAEKLLTDMNNEELLKFVELDVKSIL